ncbi:Cysteine-rich receptor-like protein kinase 42 [Platanthera guangdongensis]|uniref:Cysteine-rich receptor-like protein kinase 42 n=1 Tax=Platanthera guangdongensis TaxID=2320717 RepID=A0ABR2MAB7_9ASPA
MPTLSLIIAGRMLPSLLLLLLLTCSSSAAAANNSSPAIFLSVCVDTQTQNAQAFDVNFVDAMEKIYQNVTTSGFATSSSGSNLTVYGLGQCFNYLSPVNCQLCYSQSRVKLPHCLPSTAGRIYLDGCFLEYADKNVSSHAVDSADAYACGNTTVDKSLQLQFVNRTSDLVISLSMAYQEKEYYQVGSVQVSPDLTVYGMAQCWRSLNASGCRNCLEKGRDNILDRCFPSMEAKAMNAGCFLRYSTEPFYLHETVNDSGSHWSSAKRSVIIAVTTILGALIVVGLVLLWKKRGSAFSYSEGVSARNKKFMKSIIKSHLSYKYDDLCKATSNFSQNNKLGQGGFGAVYKWLHGS